MAQSGARSFEAELHTASPKYIVAAVLALAIAITMHHDILPNPSRATDVALLLYSLGLAAFALDVWNPLAGRWAAIAVLVALVHFGSGWLALPGSLTLLAVPAALAAPFISLPAAAFAALVETVLVLLLRVYAPTPPSAVESVVALIAAWAMVGVMLATYRPVHQLAQWSWEQFQRAQTLLEEARTRQAELRQALDDLAQANRQLALTNDRLAAARLAAEDAQKAKAAFVARVSHEFRTPLNMIIGLTDLLVETPDVYGQQLPPGLLEDLDIVQRNCEHLASMINDVLDLSQIEAGRLALHRERVDLAEVIDKAVAVVKPLLDKKRVLLHLNVPPDLSEVFCDRTRIRQVILNLLSNAARFTERGQIAVEATEQAQCVTVSVRDTGPGIASEDADRIFEPFYQVSRAARQQGNGSGLGLSISKQFVELHDGRMWLESELGVGSTFYFRLPVSPPVGPVAAPQRWLAEDWAWIQRTATAKANLPVTPLKQRVVVCDESGELHLLFARFSDDLEFLGARRLEDAIREAARCPAIAVIINADSASDLWPSVERARGELPDTPVIGCCIPPRMQQIMAAGATSYLPKPVTRAALEQAMRAVGRPIKRVLAVDDEADALKLFTRMLHACDERLEVLTASGGAGALEKLRTHLPDLVLLDVVMPEVDGWQVLAVKAGDKAIRDVPVIVVSAQDAMDTPMVSRVLMATIGQGLSVSKLLRCSRELSGLLLRRG